MKNLISYKDDAFDIHQKAISKKEDKALKERLSKLDAIIKNEYDIFDLKFKANKIEEIKANVDLKKSKEDLLLLYSYQSSVIKSIRASIEDLQIKSIINTCQNCTVTPVSSMDHILPKSAYPEFIVNPRNLFPCCTICNGHKLNSTSEFGEKKFLNLYLDELPTEQYLFVDIWIDKDNEIDYNFFLKNDFKIDTNLYATIESHYSKLNLFDRMKFKSIEGLGEFRNSIRKYSKIIGLDATINVELEKLEDSKNAYGHNHWKCILEQTLLQSNLFLNTI